ncbi:uncharacterized protein M6B38_389060 [Iris pallida]|uniref:Uncharacterized protein n=1 Tax=Iris pallida TaxID=29817 RepID=A0AAX6FYV4_IRIPA|nr:uncharacterized protein M6B38_391215 [Iris pallida]KAJ6822373.1 uncharacterized protein M6B38_389060 [Iris pallida]
MAWKFPPSSSSLPTTAGLGFQVAERLPATKNHAASLIKLSSTDKHLCHSKTAQSDGVAEEPSLSGSSSRAQLDLLEQLTSSTSPGSGTESTVSPSRPTIREQLSDLVGDRRGEFSLPLGKRLAATQSTLTISQKRNIKRQAYLNEVSGRNDTVFFATIGAFVILPPIVILLVAILTGYVQLFP